MPRGSPALRSLVNWRLLRHEEPASTRIPITRAVRPDVLATKNGDVLSVFRLNGIATDCLETQEIEGARDLLARFLRTACDARTAAWMHTIKRRITPNQAGHPTRDLDGFAGYVHHMRRAGVDGLFEIAHYLTLVRRPLVRPMPLFGRGDAEKDAGIERSEGVRKLDEAARAVDSLLGRFGPRRLSIDCGERPELLAFLSTLVNGCNTPIRPARAGLDRLIPSHRAIFRGETIHLRGAAPEDERFAAMMALKGYGEATWPGALDAMLSAPVEFIATHSFTPREVSETLGRMKWVRRQMDVADDEARSLAEGLSDAMDDVASAREIFGDHHTSIAVIANDETALADAASRMASIMTGAGLRPVREDVALEALWWAQIPGNAGYRARKALISATNLADLAPAHGAASGPCSNNVPWGAPVAILETTLGTPYRFSFHEEGNNSGGSTLIFGPSGSGKTALIGYLLAASRALPRPPRIFCFDKDRGTEATIRALGGTYAMIRPDETGLFNPFANAVDKRGQAWLRRWITERVGTVNPMQRDAIKEAVAMNAAAPPELRRFSTFAPLFDALDDDRSLSDALADWHGNGARAWLFDGIEDRLDLSPGLCGFDMTAVLRDPAGAEALVDYLFHRLSLALESGEPTIIVLDEAWRLIKSPVFAAQIEDWLKTIRKMGGLVVFVSQEPEDAARSAIAPTLISSTATKIFFPNETADEATYREVFGLTLREFELVRTTPRETRCFLVKQGARASLTRLDLSAHPEILKVLSGTATSVAELDRLRAHHGEHWLRPFMGDMI